MSRAFLVGLCRRGWLLLMTGNHFGEPDTLDVHTRGTGVRRMIARAMWADRRERGARIVKDVSATNRDRFWERQARKPSSLFLAWKRSVNQ